jgi:iron complex transport system permease protein
VVLAAPLTALGIGALALTARDLDALTLGEATARSLGVAIARTGWLVALGVGACVGAGVAAAGVIGFVGLVVPHLLRPLVGARPGALLLPSALAGALLVVLADMGVRLLPGGSELRLGVAMALGGAPFFGWLLWRLRREAE